jgi:hypothetical protein
LLANLTGGSAIPVGHPFSDVLSALSTQSGAERLSLVPVLLGSTAVLCTAEDIASLANLASLIAALPYSSGVTASALVPVEIGGVAVTVTAEDIAALGGGGSVNAVTASAPLVSSGGTTPNISFTGLLAIANGGTGTTTPGDIAGTNVTITGSWPNQTINSSSGPTALTVSTQGATNYTFVIGDANTMVRHDPTDAIARTWTIPANASVAFPIGTCITGDLPFGCGNISLAITTDTLELVGPAGSTGTRTITSGGRFTAIKDTSTHWRVSGTMIT